VYRNESNSLYWNQLCKDLLTFNLRKEKDPVTETLFCVQKLHNGQSPRRSNPKSNVPSPVTFGNDFCISTFLIILGLIIRRVINFDVIRPLWLQ
jgi:hypothetical protein